MANNAEWLGGLGALDFLRDVGKHFSVNVMLAKESVRARMETGISFTEFSYMLLQSYDFVELNRRYGVTMQVGGSDQWGNITAGTDLLRRMDGREAHGVTFPLLTTAGGTKFGKTRPGRCGSTGAHLAVPVLPVLDARRGPRRAALPAPLHPQVARGGRGARAATAEQPEKRARSRRSPPTSRSGCTAPRRAAQPRRSRRCCSARATRSSCPEAGLARSRARCPRPRCGCRTRAGRSTGSTCS
jgi:hypothetical protein